MKGPDLPELHTPSVMALRKWARDEIASEMRALENPRLDLTETTLARGRLQALRAIERSVDPTVTADRPAQPVGGF